MVFAFWQVQRFQIITYILAMMSLLCRTKQLFHCFHAKRKGKSELESIHQKIKTGRIVKHKEKKKKEMLQRMCSRLILWKIKGYNYPRAIHILLWLKNSKYFSFFLPVIYWWSKINVAFNVFYFVCCFCNVTLLLLP